MMKFEQPEITDDDVKAREILWHEVDILVKYVDSGIWQNDSSRTESLCKLADTIANICSAITD